MHLYAFPQYTQSLRQPKRGVALVAKNDFCELSAVGTTFCNRIMIRAIRFTWRENLPEILPFPPSLLTALPPYRQHQYP